MTPNVTPRKTTTREPKLTLAPEPAPTVCIYCRLSENPDGTSTSVERQEAECRAFCERMGFRVAHVYVDDDRGAYDGRPRPAFDQMMRDLARYDGIVYWKMDRLTRGGSRDFARVLDACDPHGVTLYSVLDPIDTSTPIGEGIAGMIAAQARQESWNSSLRLKSWNREQAMAGKNHGGRRPFGYDQERDDNGRAVPGSTLYIVPEEQAAILEALDRIKRGESMRSICFDWNERGITTPSGGTWRVTTFRRMITGNKIAGIVTYDGDVLVGGASAQWPAIISVDDHERIQAILGDPRVRTRGRPASYLLTAIVTCGRCGAVLRSGVGSGPDKPRTWRCTRVPGDESHCGKLVIRAEPVDKLVERGIVRLLDSPKLGKAIKKLTKKSKSTSADTATIAELEARLTELGIDRDEGRIPNRAEYLARRERLQARLDAARDALVPDGEVDVLTQFVGVDVPTYWEELPLDRKRAVARVVIESVSIAPPAPGAARVFDPERVVIDWLV